MLLHPTPTCTDAGPDLQLVLVVFWVEAYSFGKTIYKFTDH